MHFTSPLRYPGGKRKLAKFISDVITVNKLQEGVYIEPFAGGASVALHLLFNEQVNYIVINDLDRSIYSFWYCVLNETEELCRRIENCQINMETWYTQKEIQTNKKQADIVDLGFSTFFLNRTNRSGIIKAGVIGGKEQNGKWKMDVRFNKIDLIDRIKKIARYKNRIVLYNLDVIECVKQAQFYSKKFPSIIYFDPPYYNQGSALYVNHFTHQDHKMLSKYIEGLDCNWVLTYDYTPEIINMYKTAKKRTLTLNYSASSKVKGREMIAFSEHLIIPIENYSSIVIE